MELWFNTYREIKGDRKSPLVFDFSKPTNLEVGRALYEALQAIKTICGTHEGPYTLLVSGGVDSQAMIYAWKKSSVPFSVVHYSYGDNIEDGMTLEAFCMSWGIEYEVREFDVDKFITSQEYKEMAMKYDCASPHILTYLKLTSFHNETVIMGGNYLSQFSSGQNWTILALDRYRALTKHNFVPFFLCCTPGLAYAFYKSEIDLIRKYRDHVPIALGRDSGYFTKVTAYEFAGFPVINQSKKLTGFEAIKERYDSTKIDRLTKLKWAGMPSKRPFDVIFRYGLFDILPHGFYSEKNTIIHNEWINKL